nr:YggT family protein [Halothermothrix orenii]
MISSFLTGLINLAYELVVLLIFIRVIISWIRPTVHNSTFIKILRIIYELTEPILSPIRQLLPQGNLGIDFSPFIAIIILSLLRIILVSLVNAF